MAEVCLSYLNSHQVKTLSTTSSSDLQDTPFLEYCSLYWVVHAKKAPSDLAISLALKLLEDFDNSIFAMILLKVHEPYYYFVDFDKPFRLSGLHCTLASFFRIIAIMASLIEVEGCNINQKG